MIATITQLRTALLSCTACGAAAITHSEKPMLPEGWGRLTVDQATADAEASTRHELCASCRRRVLAAVNAEVSAIRGGMFG